MPEQARVFWIEDNADHIKTAGEFLEGAGHQVILTATTLDDAIARIREGLDKQTINAVITDGNLGPNRGELDGKLITAAMRRFSPQVGIIGNSATNPVEGADVQSPKIDGGQALAIAVTRLPFPFRR